MSTTVNYRLDNGPILQRICFSEPWRLVTNWKSLTFYPKKHHHFKEQLFATIGLEFDAVLDYWASALKIWGVDLLGNELTVENFNTGFTFPNKLPSSATFVATTAIRYLEEYQEVIYQMIRLGTDYPDLFHGSGKKLWDAFCIAHTTRIYPDIMPDGFGHTLIGSALLRNYPGDGVIQKEHTSIYSAFPEADPGAPPAYIGVTYVKGPEYLESVLTYLRNKE